MNNSPPTPTQIFDAQRLMMILGTLRTLAVELTIANEVLDTEQRKALEREALRLILVVRTVPETSHV